VVITPRGLMRKGPAKAGPFSLATTPPSPAPPGKVSGNARRMGSVGKRATLHNRPLPDPPLVPREGICASTTTATPSFPGQAGEGVGQRPTDGVGSESRDAAQPTPPRPSPRVEGRDLRLNNNRNALLPRPSRGRCRATPDGWGRPGSARRCTTDPAPTLPSCRGEGSAPQQQPQRPPSPAKPGKVSGNGRRMGSAGKRATLHDRPLPDPPLVPRGGRGAFKCRCGALPRSGR
jgi:hypothetical protein